MSKELKNKYIKSVLETTFSNSVSMGKHLEKSISDVVKVSGGLVAFSKPTIEKNFCYSYDEVMDCQCGTNTYEDAINACDVKAITFFNDNMKDLNRKLKMLENEKIYFIKNYYNNDLAVTFVSERYVFDFPTEKSVEATNEDVENLIAAVKSEKEKFMKRLQTYYKRYGLTKLRTWTYSIND